MTKEFEVSPKELMAGKEREINDKVETIKVLKDVLKKKMMMSNDWLNDFKKSTGNRFEFGKLEKRETSFNHDPVYDESFSGFHGDEKTRKVSYYKSNVITDPFLTVEGKDSEHRGFLFYLVGKDRNLVACYNNWSSMMGCISETGKKFMIRPADKIEDITGKKVPRSARIAGRFAKDTRSIAEIGSYLTDLLKGRKVMCFHVPEKCASENMDDINALNSIITSLDNANNGVDELKNVIVTEKQRMIEEEKKLSGKRERARASLEDWKL